MAIFALGVGWFDPEVVSGGVHRPVVGLCVPVSWSVPRIRQEVEDVGVGSPVRLQGLVVMENHLGHLGE